MNDVRFFACRRPDAGLLDPGRAARCPLVAQIDAKQPGDPRVLRPAVVREIRSETPSLELCASMACIPRVGARQCTGCGRTGPIRERWVTRGARLELCSVCAVALIDPLRVAVPVGSGCYECGRGSLIPDSVGRVQLSMEHSEHKIILLTCGQKCGQRLATRAAPALTAARLRRHGRAPPHK